MAGSPFIIIPWSNDFLRGMQQAVWKLTGGHPGNAVLVFPNKRPRRYMLDMYRRDAAQVPRLMPVILDRRTFTWLCLESWTNGVPDPACLLDRVAMLKDCVLKAAQEKTSGSALCRLAGEIEAKGMASFYPWGIRLARLLDECDSHILDAAGLTYADDENISQYASILLENLGAIRRLYHARMSEKNMSSSGLEARLAAQASQKSPEMPQRLRGKMLLIAGFVRPNGAENTLFRYFWEHGAHICLHTDPLVPSPNAHWSCQDHSAWIRSWHAGTILLEKPIPVAPTLRFFAGYDLHSQLSSLPENLESCNDRRLKKAVVLSHDSLLLPVLHCLPDSNINISLGYPLQRSMLAQLIERVLLLCESSDANGRLHWKELLGLVRHPCLRILKVIGESGEDIPMASLFRRMDSAIRSGERMIPRQALESGGSLLLQAETGMPAAIATAARRFLERAMPVLVFNWLEARTLSDLSSCLEGLCSLLLDCGGDIWEKFPLDAECLARIIQNVTPSFSSSMMVNETLPQETLFTILRQELAIQRVPFEADPIEGLQVLGMLETRLLHFDEVHLLDMTEDALPGEPSRDPLLPDNLRPLLGLPDSNSRDRLAAHTFFRLLAGVKKAFIYWQEGVQSGLMDKKTRSRFVEELIWSWEKQHGKILKSGAESPLQEADFPLPEHADGTQTCLDIKRTPDMNGAVADFLEQNGLSSSAIDSYLACPRQFFLRYLCRFREPDAIQEDDDPIGVGNLIHAVLEESFAPFLGRAFSGSSVEAGCVTEIFLKKLRQDTSLQNLPLQSLFMLEEAGPKRLRTYLENMPASNELLCLEKTLHAAIEVQGHTCILLGKADRIDLRDNGIIILDYKTGKTRRLPDSDIWKDEGLWKRLDAWTP